MIKCIVIDDQKAAVDIITNHTEKKNDLQLMGTFSDPVEAFDFVKRENIDLVFTGIRHFSNAIDRLIFSTALPLSKNMKKQFFFADIDGAKVKINFSDIVYFESVGNYVKIICHKTKVIIHKSLGSTLDILPPDDFVRVHKSYIVSINCIESYKAGQLKLNIDNSIIKIPTGVTFREGLLKKLQIA